MCSGPQVSRVARLLGCEETEGAEGDAGCQSRDHVTQHAGDVLAPRKACSGGARTWGFQVYSEECGRD